MSYSSQELHELGITLVEEAERRRATLRLLGGLAFYLNSPTARSLPGLKRDYKDLDFVVDRRGARELIVVFRDHGWTDDHYFNALHGETRMLFYYEDVLQADIFIRVFEQCHRIDFKDFLPLSKPTIPLAELLLTKLQVHRLNEKDVQDIIMLAYDHDFGRSGPSELPDLKRIIRTTSNDWRWYTTVHDNLDAIEPIASNFLSGNDADKVIANLCWIRQSIEESPKSVKWKLRAQIGRKIRWYEEPEEVNR
jgi:hypothetical protein